MTNYYVSTTGNDFNNGLSESTAFKTINKGTNIAKAGDTIYVSNGNYGFELISFGYSGTSSNPITLTTYNGPVFLVGDGTNAAIEISSKEYINVIGEFNTNGYDGGIGLNYSNHIQFIPLNGKGMNILNNSGDGIGFGYESSWITIDNVTVINAVHGLLSMGYPWVGGFHHDIIIKNSWIEGAEHNGIDIHTNNNNILIENNTITKNSGSYGVFLHNFNVKNVVVRNNKFISNTRGIGLNGASDVLIENNYFEDSWSSRAIDLDMKTAPSVAGTGHTAGIHNVTIRNNTVRTSKSYDMIVFNEDYADAIDTISDIYLINNSFTKSIWFQGGFTERITIRDIPDNYLQFIFTDSILDSSIEFTDGKIFKHSFPNTAYWYPDKSVVSISNTTYGELTNVYPITAVPTTGLATIIVNRFDTSLPLGNIIIDYNINTPNGNTVNFTVITLKPNINYLIKKDGAVLTTVQSDSTGLIKFNSSIWSTNNQITIEETNLPITVGNVWGKVLDINSNPLPDAAINSSNSSTLTDVNGDYLLQNIPTGFQSITTSKTGYITQTKQITVIENDTVILNFKLEKSILSSIEIIPSSFNMYINSTKQFIAKGKDQYGNDIDTIITWSLSDYGIGTITQDGLFSSTNIGITNIVATSGDIQGISTVTVTDIPPSLTLHLKLDENVGNIAKDSSLYENNGTIYNGTWTQGRYNSTIQFNGLSSYISIPHSPILSSDNQTVMLWFKSFDTIYTDYKGLIFKAPNTGYDREFGIEFNLNGNIDFTVGNGSSLWEFTTTDVIQTNIWYHIALVKEYTVTGDIFKVYLNGQLKTSSNVTWHGIENTNEIVIGKNTSSSKITRYFNGLIDDIKIHNKILSLQEIQDEYFTCPQVICNFTITQV